MTEARESDPQDSDLADHRQPSTVTWPTPNADTPATLDELRTAPLESEANALRAFAGFELIEKLGHGGMGVVYKARQLSLDRIVAIKLIRQGRFASADERERFQAEAQAVARLQHPHIVAVHDVGEHEGQPYFSMDYINGPNLAEVAAQNPLPPRLAARYVATIARAVQYAHEQGILHRDLKPSNILLQLAEPGATVDLERAQARITDFGLARPIEHAGDTVSGQIIGTPSYMPPEQALGSKREIGPPSDIYSLGAILYELLTGRPPFKADTPLATLDLVRQSEPAPPRVLNARIHRDLETICNKCLAKSPQRRYASAQALAEDLERQMAGMPIHARPVGAWERAWRWCGREPMAAGLLAAVGLVFTAGLSLSLWQWGRAESNAAAAGIQRDKALEHFQRLQEAVGKMTTLGLSDLRNTPGAENVRRRLLEEALDTHLQFLRESQGDQRMLWETAVAHRQAGIIRGELGLHAEAESAYRQALRGFEELAAAYPDHRDYPMDQAICWLALSDALRRQESQDEADAALGRAIGLLDQAGVTAVSSTEDAVKLAVLHRALCKAHQQAGRLPEAEAACRASIGLLEKLFADDPRNRAYGASLAADWNVLGIMLRDSRRPEAYDAYRKSLDIQQILVDQDPSDRDGRLSVAIGFRNLAMMLRDSGHLPESRRLYEAAVPIFRELAADFPSIPDHHRELAEALHGLGFLFLGSGEGARARPLLEESLQRNRLLLTLYPSDAGPRKRVPRLLHALVRVCLDGGDHRAAFDLAGQLADASVSALDDSQAVRFCAQCVLLAEADASIPQDARSELVARYAKKALELADIAVQRGYQEQHDPFNDQGSFSGVLQMLSEKSASRTLSTQGSGSRIQEEENR